MGCVLFWLLQAYLIVLIAYVVFSWVPRPPDPIRPLIRTVNRLVEPVLNPLRRVIPSVPLGGVALDLSIIVLFLLIQLLLLPLAASLC